jgi:hypothetical protein
MLATTSSVAGLMTENMTLLNWDVVVGLKNR